MLTGNSRRMQSWSRLDTWITDWRSCAMRLWCGLFSYFHITFSSEIVVLWCFVLGFVFVLLLLNAFWAERDRAAGQMLWPLRVVLDRLGDTSLHGTSFAALRKSLVMACNILLACSILIIIWNWNFLRSALFSDWPLTLLSSSKKWSLSPQRQFIVVWRLRGRG